MNMKDGIETFIGDLARFGANRSPMRLPKHVCNHYSYDFPANAARRKNLRLYLNQMARNNSHILLVGEAPGYRGCRLTGVPFSCEYIIANGIEKFGLFGISRRYTLSQEGNGLHGEYTALPREQTASIVWETLTSAGSIQTAPLMWNAFPFHPYRAGNPCSNRKPSQKELKIGESILRRFIDLFQIDTVVALGNTAATILTEMNLPFIKIRHPAHGGKREFARGIKTVLKGMKLNPK